MARSLQYGRTRFGLALLGFIVLLALVGPFVAPHAPDAVVGLPAQSPSGRSFSVPTTSATTSFHGCSGVAAAWSGWHSPRPRSGSAVGAAIGMLAALQPSSNRRRAHARNGRHPCLPTDRLRAPLRLAPRPQLGLIVVLVALTWVPQVARVARGITSDIVHREYVESAELIGLSRRRILAREILPNVTTPLMVEYGLRLDMVDRADRRDQLPRLRHPAAERRLGPDDQREPERS